jgi:hypothetical protein
MSRAAEFRQNAVECQLQAGKSLTPRDREQWLKIAGHWLKLADATEQSGPDERSPL